MLPEVNVAAPRHAKLCKNNVEPIAAKSKVGGDGSNLRWSEGIESDPTETGWI